MTGDLAKRVETRNVQMETDPQSTIDESSGLDQIMPRIREYLRSMCGGEGQSTFAKRTGRNLLLRVGEREFWIAPHHDLLEEPNSTASGLYSFDQLKALDLPKPEPVVEGLIYAGETALLAGRPKVGKSRLVAQMALDIARGAPFLNMMVPRPRRVLIVGLEDRCWAMRDRLMRMTSVDKVAGLFVWCADSLSADHLNNTPSGISKLEHFLADTRAEVLIVDPWRLWLGKDENDAQEVVAGLKAIANLRQSKPELTIIIVHHVRKERFESPRKLLANPSLWAESISGHYALMSHVDSCYGLERDRAEDGEECIVFGGIARNAEPRTLLLEDDETTLRFEVRQNESALDAVFTPKEREIWKVAKTLGQFGFTDLLTQAKVTNKKAVSSTLKKAESHGMVTSLAKRYKIAESCT
jgi:hypothetical protein